MLWRCVRREQLSAVREVVKAAFEAVHAMLSTSVRCCGSCGRRRRPLVEWCRPKACLKVFFRYVMRAGSSGYVCSDAVKISGRVLEGAKVRNAQP